MVSKSEKYLRRIRAKIKHTGENSLNDQNEILKKFKSQYRHLSEFGLRIDGVGHLIADSIVISVSVPSNFDSNLLPKSFMGLDIRIGIQEDEKSNLET